ncbi:MAG: glycosyltransferase family 2 protein [Acetobacterium sp.]
MLKEKKTTLFFLATAILMTIYLFWRIFFTLPIHVGIPNLIFGILLILAEVVTTFTTFELFFLKIQSDKVKLEMPEIPDAYYPEIDVFIATHNEDLDLLYKTANACTYMEYPDKNKVHIYFCDDTNRKEVAGLAKKIGIGYLGLSDNKNAKSGNLNNALSHTNSPLIATFDADMIPRRSFLMKTVPFFLWPQFIKEDGEWRLRKDNEQNADEKIGLVQTPQSFYNPDLFQFNLYAETSVPNEQDFFSREVNIMRNSSNAVAYTGSNTVISRLAMEEIGGFPIKTITEDFETSVRIQKSGYMTYATDQVQAAGLSTTTIQSMIKQRTRWARGVIQSIYNTNAIFTSKLPLSSKVSYLSSFLYWWSFFNRMIFILAPIMFALFNFQIVDCELWELFVFWLPAYFFYTLSMRYLSSNIRTHRWSQIIDTILAPYLIIPVFLETIGIRSRKFKVTNKNKDQSEKKLLLYAIPNFVLLILSLAAVISYVYGKYGMALFYSCIILFWLFYNMTALIYGLFFMVGRKSPRKYERIGTEKDVELDLDHKVFHVKTKDLSDDGMSFISESPIYIPSNKNFNITIMSDYYQAKLIGELVYVKEEKGKWLYTARVEPVDETNKSQYLQLIYDNDHSLPKEMDMWSTAYDDITRNIHERIKRSVYEKRKSPRIKIDKKIHFSCNSWGKVHDFNYDYFTISDLHSDPKKVNSIYDLELSEGKTLRLMEISKHASHSTKLKLFRIVNLDHLIADGFHPETLVDELKRLN